MRYLFIILLFIGCNDDPKKPGTGGGKPVDTIILIDTTDVTGKPIDTLVGGKPVEDTTGRLYWADRRPLGMLMFGNWRPTAIPPNYRNWYLQGTHDYGDFKSAAIKHTQVSIKNLKYLDAQGVIIWDIEGQQYPHSITYLGSPDSLPVLAPEMDSIADTLISMFRAAGMKIGVCLRPTVLKNLSTWPGQFVADPYITLRDKVIYARKRWGASIFYVDSNVGVELEIGSDNTGGTGSIYPAEVFKKLAVDFPSCLFIPEWTNADYDKYTAPYWHKGWAADMRAPMTVIDCGDTNWWDETLYNAAHQGNILMGRVWWDAPELEKIKNAYK